MSANLYQGIYRGRCENDIDTEGRGRILVSVADVGGKSILSWATPCLPVSGMNMGVFSVPPKGSGVWVQFERGDTDFPVWLGGYFARGEAPALAQNVPPGVSGITMQTTFGNGLVINDKPGGGILIQTAGGSKIEITDMGITISSRDGAEIKLAAGTVSINNNHLTIT
jgi:uncharacterized protein involved in type VI secretion and phage assembly